MAFTPKKKDSIKETIKNHLLNGNIIRYDMRDETPLEVIGRDCINSLSRMHNIGQEFGIVIENICCSHSNLHEVINELSAEYSVRKVSCGYSGCCQYSTYGVYLD